MVRTIFGAGVGAAISVAVLLSASPAPAQTSAGSAGMSFFITSAGPGKGADLGGLEGADRHCRQLAQAVGAGGRDWKAYLSTQAADGRPAVNARDRIGAGPWQNAKGQVIARSVEDLHATNGLTKQTGLTETGETVKGRGDTPNTHDILTGSQPDGTAFAGAEDRTCGNWTRSGAEGAAMVGHHDRMGLGDDPPAKSWNSSHLTRGGCSQDALKSTGGAGLLYCFAAD
ncbi:hypothetical protein D3869_02280 [Azospirillum brasilense]|uniref:Lectin n=1 Tax=Azospirillum brasilense TaxID=192 RepID=A0A4D8R0E6_AZOBR|nr:hypothetical protein [Azospirillum brasilense]QCO14153.1 hypothetical protein D3869_02280 [Azospirillum brasilense]